MHAAENTFTFSRRFYPKRLTVHSGYTFFVRYHFLYFLSNTKKDNLEATAKREERVHLKRKKFSPVKCTSPLQCQTSPKMERSLPGDQEVGPVELQGSGGGHWGRCPHCPRVQFKTLFSHCRRNRHQRKTETLEIFKESFSEDEEFRILSSLPSFNSHGLFSQGRESVAVRERWKLESETKTIVMTASE